jgi:hypothetical protein
MNLIKCAVLTCVATIGAALPAHAAYTAIYDVLGVYDSGGVTNTGIATAIHCSNTTANPVNVRVQVRRSDGTVAAPAVTASIPGQGTVTFSTHETVIFSDAASNLATGLVNQGRARILTEVPAAIVCAADMVDAAGFPPVFVAPRRLIRLPRAPSGGED